MSKPSAAWIWEVHQMEEYANRRNVILGIIKAHYNIVKTRPSNVKCGNINAIAVKPTHAWTVQGGHHRKFMILLISSSDTFSKGNNRKWCLGDQPLECKRYTYKMHCSQLVCSRHEAPRGATICARKSSLLHPSSRIFSLVSSLTFVFFTNTQSWQCWHNWQLCTPIHLQFAALLGCYDVSKCELIYQ